MAEKSHASSRSKAVLGGKGKSKSKGGKKPHHIEIHRGKSGGFIVKHHHDLPEDGGAPEEPDQHIVPDMDSLQSHVADNMGDQPPMPASAAPAPAPAPAPAAGGPAPAPAGM
jgi:hypothetical protein